jgi:hypothetical protein
MKKIFLIFFTFLFFNSSVSYSKIITLKDCYTDVKGYKSFDKNVYEDYKFVIDTNKNIVTLIYVWTDKEIKKQLEQVEIIIKKRKDSGQKYEHLESLRVMDKVNTGRFNINFIDTNYVTGELDEKNNTFKQSINIILQNKTISYTIENKQDKTKKIINYFCK